jgi:two-component system NtrC family sensor kinase
VRQGLNATFALLKHRMGDVAIERRYATDRLVAAPAGPINQVLLNVVDNALRAGARRIVASVTGGPDGAVLVRIEDDGPGVPQPLAERVFDPFFTTRPPGDGSGLGLHLSRQIMRQLGGEIRLTTTAPRGAAFEIQFPAEFPRSGGSDV